MCSVAVPPRWCRSGWSQLTAAQRFDVEIHRWAAQPRARLDGDRSARASSTRRPRTPIPTAALGRCRPGADQRLASGFYLVTFRAHDAPTDRALAYTGFIMHGGPRRARVARDRHQHVQRVQQLGWVQPLHRRSAACRSARPFGRGMLVRPSTDADDRGFSRCRLSGRGNPDIDGLIYQEYRFANGYPGFMSSAGSVHLRAALRRVGGGGRRGDGLRRVERPRCRIQRHATATTSCSVWATTVLVGRAASGDRSACAQGWQLRQLLRQRDALWQVRLEDDRRAMRLKSRAHGGRPGRRHRCPSDDDGDVERPAGRRAGGPRCWVPARRTACTAGSARHEGPAHSPSIATSTGCSRAPGLRCRRRRRAR